MARYVGHAVDQYGRDIPGAYVTVVGMDGSAATLTDDYGNPISQPLKTDDYGGYYFNTTDGLYTITIYRSGLIVTRLYNVIVGDASTLPAGSVMNSLGTATDIAPSQNAITTGFGAANGGDLSGITPSGTGAVTRGAADVVKTLGFQAESFGTRTASDARTAITNLLNASASAAAIAIMAGTYSTSAGAVNPNPNAADPDPSAFYITASDTVTDGMGTGAVTGTAGNKSVFHVKNPAVANRPRRVTIQNFTISQNVAQATPEASGLNDDYFAIRFEAGYNCSALNIHMPYCTLGYTDQFAESAVYCNYFTFDAAVDVDPATDIITLNKGLAGVPLASVDFVTGDAVAMSLSGTSAWGAGPAVAPTGIAAPYRGFAIVISPTQIKIASSQDNAFAGTAIDITAVGSGTITLMSDARASKYNVLQGFSIEACAYMGAQLGSCQLGTYEGTVKGVAKDGHSRGSTHGLRSDGFWFALTAWNNASFTVERMSNGLSLQGFSENNTYKIIARDCQNGVSVTRTIDAISTPKNNVIDVTSTGGDYGVFDDGGSFNTYLLNIRDAALGGVNATNGGAITGLATGNRWTGRITRSAPGSTYRAMQLDGLDTYVDVSLLGSGTSATDSGFGALITGSGISGTIRARGFQIGVQLTGTGGSLRVKTNQCGTDLVIAATASNLVVYCDCDGNVSIAAGASNITLIGRVGGTITNNGTGSRIQVVAQAGWTIGTGTANKGTFAAYAGATMSAAYVQAEAQATNDAAKAASQRLLALEQAVRVAGLIT